MDNTTYLIDSRGNPKRQDGAPMTKEEIDSFRKVGLAGSQTVSEPDVEIITEEE